MDDTLTEEVLALAAWIQNDVEQVAAAAGVAIWAQVPAYPANPEPTLRQHVEDHCRQVYIAFVTTLLEGRRPESSDFRWTAGHALNRVEYGISLPDFLKAFRIGQATMWDHVLDSIQNDPRRASAALAVVGHLMQTIEVGSSTAAEAYLESAKFRGADAERIQRDLLEDLLAGRHPVVEARLDLLSLAGLATDTAILVGVARTPAAPTGIPLLSEAAHASSIALATEVSGMVVVRQDEVVGVFPAEPLGEKTVTSRIEKLVSSLGARGLPLTVGVSTVRRGLAAVPEAYREATLARETLGGMVGVRSLSALSTLDYLVIRPDESARQLIRPEVRAFIEEDLAADHVFVDTLLRYVEGDMNAKAAAAALHVHANTVYYRLERITERTGCDLRRVGEVIELLLAVRLLTAR